MDRLEAGTEDFIRMSETPASFEHHRICGPVCIAVPSHSQASVPPMSVWIPYRGDARLLTAPERRDRARRARHH